MYINLRDPITQIILIIIVNVAAIITVETAIYRIKKSQEEEMIELILFAIAMIATFFLFIYLLYMNGLIYTLSGFVLQFSYEWASRHYLMLRLGFLLLSIIVITSLGMVLLYRKVSKVKAPGVERERYFQTLVKRGPRSQRNRSAVQPRCGRSSAWTATCTPSTPT